MNRSVTHKNNLVLRAFSVQTMKYVRVLLYERLEVHPNENILSEHLGF